MSTNRTNPKAGWAKPSGLCRYCGLDVKRFDSRKRTFCSDACVHEWKIRSDIGYARNQIFKRDRGICACCGLDTERLHKEYYACVGHFGGPDRKYAIELFWSSRGQKPISDSRVSWWDADHILEVKNGGGECGMENLQTLCWFCHAKKHRNL